MPDVIYSVTWNGTEKVNYTYDSLGRLTGAQGTVPNKTEKDRGRFLVFRKTGDGSLSSDKLS